MKNKTEKNERKEENDFYDWLDVLEFEMMPKDRKIDPSDK
jgi:hypothetical protein